MKRFYRQWLSAIIIGSVLLSGCGRNTDNSSEIKEGKGYSLSEIMIVAATEKNRYEEVYTDQIWQVKVGEENISFEEYLQQQVETFMNQLKIMNLLAVEKGIEQTGGEKEQIRQLSEEYYSSLTREDLTYMNATKEDVLFLYSEYHMANKLVNELTRDLDLEVSDNEAKVITVQLLRLNDSETAKLAYEEISVQEKDFDAVFKSYSAQKEGKRQVGRGELSPALESAAFSLETGQVSQIVEADGAYYLIKAVSAYDENATLERKKKLSAERKNAAFQQIYNQFLEQNQVELQHNLWKQVSFSETNGSTTRNFFELYKEYFPD